MAEEVERLNQQTLDVKMRTDDELDSLLSKIKAGAKKHTGLRDDHDKL